MTPCPLCTCANPPGESTCRTCGARLDRIVSECCTGGENCPVSEHEPVTELDLGCSWVPKDAADTEQT